MTAASATDQLLNLGLPGLVILGLLGAIVYLRLQNERLYVRLGELQELRLSDRDLRLTDQKANTEVMLELHDEIGERLKALDRIRETLERAQEMTGKTRPRV
jgi:glucose-6-phosphate-specific signal transduction histidine kinase